MNNEDKVYEIATQVTLDAGLPYTDPRTGKTTKAPIPENQFTGWQYTKLSKCSSFWHWLHSSWNIRRRREGPYVLIRESGSRWFGIEYIRERKEVG